MAAAESGEEDKNLGWRERLFLLVGLSCSPTVVCRVTVRRSSLGHHSSTSTSILANIRPGANSDLGTDNNRPLTGLADLIHLPKPVLDSSEVLFTLEVDHNEYE